MGSTYATEEDEIQYALEVSAREATKASASTLNVLISTKFRNELIRVDKHRAINTQDGIICQFNTLNQFGEQFDELKMEFSCPSAICGWLTAANMILLQKYLLERDQSPLTMSDINEFVSHTLCDLQVVLPELRKCIQFTQSRREAYWVRHGKQHADRRDLMTWVANYELADLLKAFSRHDLLSLDTYRAPIFVRYNQWPEIAAATQDEAEQLQSEKRFGGVANPADGSIFYGDGDSVYFIEEYKYGSVSEARYTPEEWAEQCRWDQTDSSSDNTREVLHETNEEHTTRDFPRTVAINLNGHFVAGLACRMDGINYLILFNTTQADYVEGDPMVCWAFDAAFVPSCMDTNGPLPSAVS